MSAYQPPVLHNNVLNTVFNPNDFIEPNTEPYLPLIGGTISGALKVLGTTTLTGATTSSALITTSDLKVNNAKIHIGTNAGLTIQGTGAVAIGSGAGQTIQGSNTIAIGNGAGTSQGDNSVAIGGSAGTGQGVGNTAIGYQAGRNPGGNDVAIGILAAGGSSGGNSVSIGNSANNGGCGLGSIGIGISSSSGGTNSVAIGNSATTAGNASCVALGPSATCSRASQVSIGTTTSNYRLAGMYANNYVAYRRETGVLQSIPTGVGTAVLHTTTIQAGNCGIGYNSGTGVFTNNNAYPVVCSVSFGVVFAANNTFDRLVWLETAGSRRNGAIEIQAGAFDMALSSSTNIVLATTETFRIIVFQNTGAALNIGNATIGNEVSMLVW